MTSVKPPKTNHFDVRRSLIEYAQVALRMTDRRRTLRASDCDDLARLRRVVDLLNRLAHPLVQVLKGEVGIQQRSTAGLTDAST